MKIIIFSGKAEAGKTTAANILKGLLEADGYRAVKAAYGDYVKYVAGLLGWNGHKDEDGMKFLQELGDGIRREYSKSYWVDIISELVKALWKRVDYVLIDDARYQNEILSREYATAIRIERPGHENALTPEQRNHISEVDLDGYKFDHVLTATDYDELRDRVETLYLWHIRGEAKDSER